MHIKYPGDIRIKPSLFKRELYIPYVVGCTWIRWIHPAAYIENIWAQEKTAPGWQNEKELM